MDEEEDDEISRNPQDIMAKKKHFPICKIQPIQLPAKKPKNKDKSNAEVKKKSTMRATLLPKKKVGEKKSVTKTITGPLKGEARKQNRFRWRKLIKDQSSLSCGGKTKTQPCPETVDALHQCLARAASQQLQCRSFPPVMEDPLDSGQSINFLTFPDVFVTKKRNRPKPYVVPPDQVKLFSA